jgi:hypothetical protein
MGAKIFFAPGDWGMSAINSPNKLVIPAAAKRRAGIQKKPRDYWIPAFARMTGAQILDCIFNLE